MQNHLADGVRVGLTRDSSHQGDNNECFHIAASLTDCVWVWWEKRLYRQHLLTTGTLVHSPTHHWYTLVHSPTHRRYTLVCYHLLTDSTPLLTDGTAVAQVNQDLPNSALGSARESAPDLRRCTSFLLGWCSLRSKAMCQTENRRYKIQLINLLRYVDLVLVEVEQPDG